MLINRNVSNKVAYPIMTVIVAVLIVCMIIVFE